jgi:hypothetical protein
MGILHHTGVYLSPCCDLSLQSYILPSLRRLTLVTLREIIVFSDV